MAKGATKKTKLRVDHTFHVPLEEVSGICLRRGKNGDMALVAVGDRVAMLAWALLPRSNEDPPDWQTLDLTKVPGTQLPAKDPQIEAVCADGEGRVLLLQESPPRAEVVNFEARKVVATIKLVVEDRSPLARSWADPKGSRGEGAVLLANGHLLVAKEKDPSALIEFGPAGSQSQGLSRGGALAAGARWPIAEGDQEFVALAVWEPEKALTKTCDDFSDLEIGPDGRLYLLSDKSASIAQLGDLPAGGGTATLTASWRLEDLGAKPEGLAFSATGRPVVALDQRKMRGNLVLLDRAIAASDAEPEEVSRQDAKPQMGKEKKEKRKEEKEKKAKKKKKNKKREKQ